MIKSLAIAALCVAAVAARAEPGAGGFVGPDNVRVVTASETAGLADDTAVSLEGYVVRSLGDEKYEFRDDTGTLTVEIDDEEWRGLEVTPERRVHIRGEIDLEGQAAEIDVDAIRAADAERAR